MLNGDVKKVQFCSWLSVLLIEACQPRVTFLCLKMHPKKGLGLHWDPEHPCVVTDWLIMT